MTVLYCVLKSLSCLMMRILERDPETQGPLVFKVPHQSENLGSILESSFSCMKGVVLCMKKLHFISRNWHKEK